MPSQQRTLIVHDGPNDYIEGLKTQFPDHRFELCLENETVEDAIIRVDPTIALAFRSGRFPGPAHIHLLNAPNIKWFQSGGAGIDHLPHWNKSALTVTNAAGVSGKYMAETVMGAVLLMNFGFSDKAEFEAMEKLNIEEANTYTKGRYYMYKVLLKSIERYEALDFLGEFTKGLALKKYYLKKVELLEPEIDQLKAKLNDLFDNLKG